MISEAFGSSRRGLSFWLSLARHQRANSRVSWTLPNSILILGFWFAGIDVRSSACPGANQRSVKIRDERRCDEDPVLRYLVSGRVAFVLRLRFGDVGCGGIDVDVLRHRGRSEVAGH